jgi:signal transduction histidine kinase
MNDLNKFKLIGQMATGLSHEIRNPLTTVRGFLQLFKLKERSVDLMQHYDLMISELDRANKIISDLLSLGNTKCRKKLDSLNDVITLIYPILEVKAQKEEKEIKLNLGRIPCIYMDRDEIKQMIINIVTNGLESMERGTVIIKTSLERENVVLSIQDEGTGINNNYMNKVWNPFFTTKDNGIGLGLPKCQSIVNKHNARMSFVTDASGTTFIIKFAFIEEFKIKGA